MLSQEQLKYAPPIRGSGSVAPFHTPIRGSLRPLSRSSPHPYPGFGTCGPSHSPLSGVWDQVTPMRGFLRLFSGSCFFSPLSGVWDPGARHLGPFKSPPMRGFATPFRVFRSHPLFRVLLRRDEVVREPDILTGPAGLDVAVVEHLVMFPCLS